ncbi:MAG TPA: TIGR00730 family Rossman fold protein [Acidimicrobiales bacterium]|nr:TIGR00730 family Rossman fold protein [Acidimicrobiales bacterium]
MSEVDETIRELLDEAGAHANRDVLRDILRSAVGLAGDDAQRLDLKIMAAALKEMRAAFAMFRPLEEVPKVTIFGSARTQPDDPLYAQARELAAQLADRGWMVITGAGPGIMAAGAEGAGPGRAIGISIRLPFEEAVGTTLSDSDLVVAMKYFFTRKLMLMKESSAFVCLPGGFGTQDETFELCTLLQTGKASPAPVVLLDVPGGTYWRAWVDFVDEELVRTGLVSPADHELYLATDDVATAVAEVERFWRSYHSIRWVGDVLVVRLRHAPTEAEVASLNQEFADLLVDGRIEPSGPLPAELSDRDNLELPRLRMRYDPRAAGRLRALIDALNDLPSAQGSDVV